MTSKKDITEGKVPVLKTPDGRYLIVGGRLWRTSNPNLTEKIRAQFVADLVNTRRQLRSDATSEQRSAARAAVDEAKRGLGERGPVWWDDEAPDFNRHLVRNTPYARWFAELETGDAP